MKTEKYRLKPRHQQTEDRRLRFTVAVRVTQAQREPEEAGLVVSWPWMAARKCENNAGRSER